MTGNGFLKFGAKQNNLLVNLPLTPAAGLVGKVAGGVTFARASDQWYQDDSGVWQKSLPNVPAFNSKGILLEPPSTNKCTCYGVIPADSLSAEKLSNTGFDTDTVWTKEAGWAIAGGVAQVSASSGAVYQNISAVSGKVYAVTYTIVSCASGSFAARSGAVFGPYRSAPGTYTDYLVCSGGGVVGVQASNATGSIDNVSCKEVQYAVGTKSAYVSGAWVQNHTNMTLSGDTAAVLTTVDDSTALLAAGLQNLCLSGKVYKLDNSAGVAAANVETALTGNTNPHSIHVFARGGAGAVGLSGVARAAILASGAFLLRKQENVTPSTSGNLWRIVADPGQIIYFILPQLEELPFSTSPVPSQGATATRAATTYTLPAANWKSNDMTVYLEWTFPALPGTVYPSMFSQIDVNNALSLVSNQGASFAINKRIGGIYYTATKITPTVAGATYKLAARLSSITGVQIFVNGVGSGGNANTSPASLGTTISFPAQTPCYIKNFRVYRRALSDAQCVVLTS